MVGMDKAGSFIDSVFRPAKRAWIEERMVVMSDRIGAPGVGQRGARRPPGVVARFAQLGRGKSRDLLATMQSLWAGGGCFVSIHEGSKNDREWVLAEDVEECAES